MNQTQFNVLGTMLILFALATPLAGLCHADSPLPPPAKQTIWSLNRRFFAVLEPDQQITTIYRAVPGKPGEKVWSMYGWFRWASLSDDGNHLVTTHWQTLIPVQYNKQQVMLYFFKKGELVNYVTLDQLIRDDSKLERTVSHYHWGDFEGFDQAGHYVAVTVEGRRIRFDVTKGTPIPEKSPQRPSAQTGVSPP